MSEKGFFFKIPQKFKREFIYHTCRENMLRMAIIAAGLSLVELFVAFYFKDSPLDSFTFSITLACLSLLLLPILLYTYQKIGQLSIVWIMTVQTCFLMLVLLGGIFCSLLCQNVYASGNAFLLAIFAISALVSIPPFKGTIIFLTAFTLYAALLPYYQDASEIVSILRVNSFCMSLLAAVMNRIVYWNQYQSFMQNMVIEEKNRELEAKNKELTEMTMRDSMTSLFNHKNSIKRLKEEIDRAKRIQYPLSVAMIDLDNFKLINDVHGHLAGDEVLIQVANILKKSCRSTDTIGRYGGEEFIIIMPDTDLGEAALLIKRIKENVKEAQFDQGIKVTLSGGVSDYRGESVHGLIRSSDLMLYRAKKKGKNRVEINDTNDKKSAVAK